MERHDDIRLAVDEFADTPRAFMLSEVRSSIDPCEPGHNISELMDKDSRFLRLTSAEEGDWFVSKELLTSWLINLNLKLARAATFRLNGHQWRMSLNSLRAEGGWDETPSSLVEFGSHLGLLGQGHSSDHVAFPFATILASLDKSYAELACQFAQRVAGDPDASISLTRSLANAVDEVLISNFPDKIVGIIKAREGLQQGVTLTLEELGNQMGGLSRERVRQLEKTFWDSLSREKAEKNAHREFLWIFLREVLMHNGSLVWHLSCKDMAARLFLAKCLDVPYLNLPDGLVAFGHSSEVLEQMLALEPKQALDLARYVDGATVVRELASDKRCGLVLSDLQPIAESLSSDRRRRLSKGQRVYLTLQEMGRPTHFSEIAEHYNASYPEDQSSERSIHAILGREQYGIVWVGIRGTFALQEWGFSRPTNTLFDTTTTIVTEEYKRTGKPVSTDVISAELHKHRQLVDPTSFIFVTHMNKELRYVLSEAFVPTALVRTAARKHTPDDPTLATANTIDKLPISSIAGPEFHGRQLQRVATLTGLSVGHLKELMYTGKGPVELADAFSTRERLLRAEAAVVRFEGALLAWKERRRDTRAAWIVPEKALSRGRLSILVSQEAERIVGAQMRPITDAERWLPFLSIELARVIKNFRSADFAVLQKMLVKANRYARIADDVRPWSTDFPGDLACLSIYWLYQYEPTPPGLRLLKLLAGAYCTNLGHLVALHPQAVRLIQKNEATVWTHLAIALTQAGLLEDVSNADPKVGAKFDLILYLSERSIEIIDKRPSGGCLWVIGGFDELSRTTKELGDRGIRFTFSPNGGRATGHRPSWYTVWEGWS